MNEIDPEGPTPRVGQTINQNFKEVVKQLETLDAQVKTLQQEVAKLKREVVPMN